MSEERKETLILTLTGAFVAAQLVALTLLPTLGSSSPPLDVVEGWIWAPHWLLGTYKHPPMPAWTMQALHWIVPSPILAPYLLSQLAIALTYLLVFLTGSLVLDRQRAAAGILLMAGSFYFTVPTIEYNHNVLQMPFWAAIIFTTARLRSRPSAWSLWLLLGALAGLGLYVKYAFAMLLIVVALYSLFEKDLRAQYLTFRPYAAALICLVIFAPHLKWIVDSNFQPFTYALQRASNVSSFWRPLGFAVAQLADHAPILLLLAIAGVPAIRRGKPTSVGGNDLWFLRLMTFGPLFLTVAVGFGMRTGLLDMWGMPMFTTAGLWLVAELQRHWPVPAIKRLAFASIILVGAVGIALGTQPLWSHKKSRTAWPTQEIAQQAEAIWAKRVGKALMLVGGDEWWVPGLVAIGADTRPDVIIGNDLSVSPWVSPEKVKREGVLYIARSPSARPDYCAPVGETATLSPGPGFPEFSVSICMPEGGQ